MGESGMMASDEFLSFAEEEKETKTGKKPPWKVIVADDDESIQELTKHVLRSYEFDGRKLRFISAYSGKETLERLEEHPDTALILLDVVMESDHAGLEAVKAIREDIGNSIVRIILRTGQPGMAPEKSVIMDYDINDYKDKTELTAQRLFTTITSSLRSYRDLMTIEMNRRGLEKIIDSMSNLFETQSLERFAEGALTQLISILDLDRSALYSHTAGFACSGEEGSCRIIAGTGEFLQMIGESHEKALPPEVMEMMREAAKEKRSVFTDTGYVGYFPTSNGSQNLIYLKGYMPSGNLDRDLVQIFSSNLAVAFDNIHLNREVIATQREVIYTLGEAVDMRSKETANHVKRVGEYSALLAGLLGLDESEVNLIRAASPLHDVGKIGIPDAILKKVGKLTEEERDLIKSHAFLGYSLLKESKREILRTAAVIAHQHHENFDGSGYPRGLKGEDIHLYGRITKFADVFDALSTERCYKAAWTMDRVAEEVRICTGTEFDPQLAELFLNNMDSFEEIKRKHPG